MTKLLQGKAGIILGVADEHSIAWAITQLFQSQGARLIVTYQNERVRERVQRLCESISPIPGREIMTVPCDVTIDEEITRLFELVQERFGNLDFLVHSIAYANREDLRGSFSEVSREGFRVAMEVSCYSLIPLVKQAAPLMKNGGSVVAMTFQASQRVFSGYNVMALAKAALEAAVRQLAAEYGPKNIRVNAVSAGPLNTISARVIGGFQTLKGDFRNRSALQRDVTHEETAKAALALCSNLLTATTGSIVFTDSGAHIMV